MSSPTTSQITNVGPTTDENINERVQLWHESGENAQLHEFLGLTFREYAFWVEAGTLPQSVAERAEISGADLPLVTGRMERSNADFERACRVLIQAEQSKLDPDNALVAVLADGVRLAREYSAEMNRF